MKLTLRRRIRPGMSLEKMRKQSARTDHRIGGNIGNCVAREVSDAPVPTLRITAPDSREDRVVLYFHGGGFCMHMPNTYKRHAARISEQAGAVVYLVDYRLAPEHNIRSCYGDAISSYRWLLEQGTQASDIIIAGDSAGGALTLGTCQRARDEGLPQPAGMIMLAPGLDATFDTPSMQENDGKDPMFRLDGLCYLRDITLNGEDPADPALSPGRASLAGLPPMRFDVSTIELLRDDSRIAVRKAREQGSTAELHEWPSVAHVFQIVSWLPETRKWLADAGNFARQCWKAASASTDANQIT
jgi:acetyl esterase/lipase